MKQIGKFILSAVLVLAFIGCSKESDKSAAEAMKEQSKEMGAAMTDAAEKTVEAVKDSVAPAMDKAMESVSEAAEASKETVTETVAVVTEAVTADSAEPTEDKGSNEPTEHIVKGVITQWQPLVTYAQPGDTIRFTGMTGHDTASMEGMIPEGAESWHSKLGQEGFTVTVEKEGGYVYKCTPHITTGMVGIIIVGDKNPANLAQLEENSGKVKIGGNMVKRAIRKLKKQIAP